MEDKNLRKIGTGIFLKKGNKVLLGYRKKEKCWTMPGGKIEEGESLIGCIKRETLEEAGITVKDVSIVSVVDYISDKYIVFGFLSENFQGEAKDMEPDVISDWQWFDLDKLPSSLFKPSADLLKNYISGKIYSF